ncbi:hypothetical protein GCM10017044_07990 [Kordiimonas sediminis]|uniref:HPt domain-containing protein n=1 Tax=Kordiimonas sediminis TaxID=1735581 RepID=A0A919AMK2_9PROT|nr:Hpt domain-containing protein [Kordiimonas sediminis]GHF16121.1 hypothetical protein GCM10017044_07990 [Kordiimonas sediminis]
MTQDHDFVSEERKAAFQVWITNKLAELDGILDQLSGVEKPADSQVDQLKAVVHDIKGTGGSFGYAELSRLAADLYSHLDASQENHIPLQPLCGQYITWMRALFV